MFSPIWQQQKRDVNSPRITLSFFLLIFSTFVFILWFTKAPQLQSVSPEIQSTKHPIKPKILLLAYPRSGSSLTSGLLTLYTNHSLFYEPFRFLTPMTAENKLSTLTKMFTCHEESFKMKMLSVNKLTREGCLNSSGIVIKTIRLAFKEATHWLQHNPWIKVIHLVRDPRSMYLSNQERHFSGPSYESLCEGMADDIDMGKKMPQERYFLLKYEDLVKDMIGTAKKLFNFAEIPMIDNFEKKMRTFSHKEDFGKRKLGPDGRPFISPYSIFKSPDFNPYRNLKEQNIAWRLQMALKCSNVVAPLGYRL